MIAEPAPGNKPEIFPAAEQLQRVKAVYDEGRCLDAWTLAQEIGPLACWRGVEARILAARLASVLGHQQLALVLFYRAWKEHPESSKALYYYARGMMRRFGYYAVRQLILRHQRQVDDVGEIKARWLAFLALLDAHFRDFERADSLMASARKADPDDPWILCELSYILELEDKYEEALATIREACKQRPHYRPAIQQEVYLLQLMGRDEEALQLMLDEKDRIQSFHFYWQLLDVLIERKRYHEAHELLNDIERVSPIRDKYARKWLLGRRADLAYYQGDYDLAMSLAEEVGTPFYKEVIESLKSSPRPPRRKLLEVDFIRQHHNTCGPAIISALCTFLGKPVAQQTIVDSIWYAGTTDYDERKWALENGLYVREFRLDWNSAVSLIDRGLPFAVSTVEPNSAHLQAVVGYDQGRGILFIRDPFERDYKEFLAKHFFERYACTGPRAMVLVPQERAADLNDVTLPEVQQFDAYFDIQNSLISHDIQQAKQLAQAMNSQWPNARMSLYANLRIAYYENNGTESLAILGELLKLFPDNAGLHLQRQNMMAQMGQKRERQHYLKELCEGNATIHPVLKREYIEVLAEDARENHKATLMLKEALRQSPRFAEAYFLLADICWRERNYAESLDLYRIAASLEIANENYALTYFRAARVRGKGQEVLQWLKARAERFIAHGSRPVMTLYRALELMNAENQGIHYLQEMVKRRPEDNDLKMFLLGKLGELGYYDKAEVLLNEVHGAVREIDWIVSRAELSELKGDYATSMEYWRKAVAEQPLYIYAQRRLAKLLGQLQGRRIGIEYLQGLVAQHPNNLNIHEILLEWMEGEAPAEVEPILRHLISIDKNNAWAYRELAIILAQQARIDDAFKVLDEAQNIEPNRPATYVIRGDLYRQKGQHLSAVECYKQAIKMSVDTTSAYNRLLECAADAEQRREFIQFIREELAQQIVNGDALLTFYNVARGVLNSDEVLMVIREAWTARKDLWSAWSALITQLQDMQEFSEAEDLAVQATERFPLLPRLWLDRARGLRLKGEYESERIYLKRALEINPQYSLAIRQLAENYEHSADYEASLELLSQAVSTQKTDALLYGFLADVEWKLKKAEDAIGHLTKAVELDPGYTWAWNRLKHWSQEANTPEVPEQVARVLVDKRPGDPQAWRCLSRVAADYNTSLEAIEHALRLDPGDIENHKQKLHLLVDLNRYEEALEQFDAIGSLKNNVALAIYHPWILRCQGKVKQAIEEMQAIIRDEPNYAEAWRLLSAWAGEADERELELEASSRYVDLEPNDADAIAKYAELLLKHGKRKEAKQQLEHATRLAPDAPFVVFGLFDAYLEDNETEAARALFSSMEEHLRFTRSGPYVESRLGQLLAKEKDKNAALAQLATVARLPDDNRWLMDTIIAVMEENDWHQDVENYLEEEIKDISALGPVIGKIWSERQKKQDNWFISTGSLANLAKQNACGMHIADAYLDYLIEKNRYKDFDKYVRKCHKALRNHNWTWATVGLHYAKSGKYKDCIKWMRDWKNRDYPAWGLNALAFALRESRQWNRAHEVACRALDMEEDNAIDHLRLYVALESGIRGDAIVMRRLFPLIEYDKFNAYNRFAYDLLSVLYQASSFPQSELKGHIQDFRRGVDEAKKRFTDFQTDAVTIAYYKRVTKALANNIGSFPLSLLWWYKIA